MYEPFASNLGTASLLKHLDVAHHAVEKFNDASDPEPEVTDLLEQIRDLVAAVVSLDDLAKRERRYASPDRTRLSAADQLQLQSVCSNIITMTQECTEFIEPLRSRLEDIRGIMGSATAESRLANQSWYKETYEGLRLRTEVLQVLFSAINVLLDKNDADEDGQRSNQALLTSPASGLQYQIGVVNPKLHSAGLDSTTVLRKAIAAARGVTMLVPASFNQHSNIGRSVKPFYTGRETQMAKLRDAFGDVAFPNQKRFVIYGLGGSGKTELALKYANDHLQSYWGVFFVDGSSRKNAAGSYLEIATIGGVEPNEKAAKNWLTTRALSWLLIIDNVDDDEVRLEELLPIGTQGCILITSRNPALKSWGTAGEQSLELLPMETEEANELILRAAQEPAPWAKNVQDSASTICQALGFLPLALVHAGNAILNRLCRWHEYLGFYDRRVQRIRRARQHRRRSLSRNRMPPDDEDDNMNVFATYEILYESLSSSKGQNFQDAIELLHVFSYLHFQNIRLDIFINAATNPLKEAKQRDEAAKEFGELQKRLAKLRRITWSTWLREQVLRLAQYLDTPPALPSALKNLEGLNISSVENEVRDRLYAALSVLVARSLVTEQDRLESRYSMHRLVHEWVRERPDISASQQALWCQVASTVLAKGISLPPNGEEENEKSMRRELLPHINQVRSCQKVIKDRLKENRIDRKLYWPIVETEFGKLQAIEAARFSRVYSECGHFKIAYELQSKVRDFAIDVLGEEHVLSIHITLFLTSTLYELTRVSDATRLQRRVHDVCLKSLGQDHPLTLMVTDSLGSSLCFQGRWAESLALHERAVEGFRLVFGEDHEKTFMAMNNVAKVHERNLDFEKSAKLHLVAYEGMKKRLGDLHFDTILCLENFAMSSSRLGGEHLTKSHDMMNIVLSRRKKTLVKEHPYILLAICNLGRVKSAMGQHVEAERIMRDALTIAERNLGEDHFGVISGRTHYAHVLVQVGRYEEAERIFHAVEAKPQYRQATDEDGEHPDRIIALWFLTGCLEKQGRFQEALQVCERLMKSLQEIGGEGRGTRHKFAILLREEIDKLNRNIIDSKRITDNDLEATKDFQELGGGLKTRR